MIEIKYGKEYGDSTSEYFIRTDCQTVGEFIDEWLSTEKGECGTFGIKSKEEPFLGEPKCEYKNGKIISEPLPKRFLNKKIKSVTGSGGWSLSNFIFEVEDIKRKRFKVWVLDDKQGE